MKEQPLISILMNCYNSEKYLEETLQSLMRQDYQRWQLVFVDNHSTDRSVEILRRYLGSDERLFYIQTPQHCPLGEAREYGLAHCQGDMLCFLDTDDIWLPQKLSRQAACMQAKPHLLLCYSAYYFINAESQRIGQRKLGYREGDLFGCNLSNYQINFQTVMIRRQALESINKPYFDPILRYSPDYNLFMRILAAGPAVCLADKLVKYRRAANSLTARSIDLWGIESEYTYQQLETAGILTTRSSEKQRALARAKIGYYKAASAMLHGEHALARSLLKSHRLSNYKYFGLYLLSAWPFLWNQVHRWRSW